jgi:hypothetical protein
MSQQSRCFAGFGDHGVTTGVTAMSPRGWLLVSQWRPLSSRDDPEYDALHAGVPSWLKSTLLAWLAPFFKQEAYDGSVVTDFSRIREMERLLRIDLSGISDYDLHLKAIEMLANDERLLLNAVDLALLWCDKPGMSHQDVILQIEPVSRWLSEAGSAWQVAMHEGKPRLERRVDATVTASARQVMSVAGRAGQHLAAAWTQVYGRQPSASEGYKEAVRAVEAAASPIVIPRDPQPTLGKIIPALRAAPSKWRVVLRPSSGPDPVETVAHMCELFWKSQRDRHGVIDESVPLNVSLEEAQAAVHLATTLVQWFTSGAVAVS